MKFSTTSIAYLTLTLSPLATATTSCTDDTALPWSSYVGGGGGNGGGTCDAACQELQAQAQCNSQAYIDDTQECITSKLKLKKRQTIDLECTSSETCLFFTDGSLLCMNEATANYHDDVGGSGNGITGVYTAADGEVQTVTGSDIYDTAPATAAPTASSTRPVGAAAATTVATRTSAASNTSGTSRASGAAETASSAAAASQTNGAMVVRGGGAIALAAMPLFAGVF